MLPGHAAWRCTPTIGKPLNPESQIVRANHFLIDSKSICGSICQYAIHIYKYGREGLETTDCAAEEDSRITSSLLLAFRDKHPEWKIGKGVGLTYNGRSVAYSSSPLPLPDLDSHGQPFLAENIALPNIDGSESKKKYSVTFTFVNKVLIPEPTAAAWGKVSDSATLTALDTPILSFARWGIVQDEPEWFVVGSKAFRSTGRSVPLAPGYVAMRGYYAGLKICLAGLCLVSDMSVSCFLAGGPMIEIMAQSGGFRDVKDMIQAASGKQGLNPRQVDKMTAAIKNSKIKLDHIGHLRKAKRLGPAANSMDSAFLYKEKKITVADYFAEMAKVAGSPYAKALAPSGKLKYPYLPCVNVGSVAKPVLVPCELVTIPGGQSRSQACTGDMTAKMIREAAVKPEERMRCILDGDANTGGGSIINVIRGDTTTREFGLHNIAKDPIALTAILLPPAKLRYGDGKTLEPLLTGTWNNEGYKFAKFNPNAIKYGIVVVGGREAPAPDILAIVGDFQKDIERDASRVGLKLVAGGPIMSCPGNAANIHRTIFPMVKGANFLIMVMLDDCYGAIKLEADKLSLMTQCAKFDKIHKNPRGYTFNIMLKINTKLGGVNHMLESRLPGAPRAFQDPPV